MNVVQRDAGHDVVKERRVVKVRRCGQSESFSFLFTASVELKRV